jgi:hypothetical protein
MRVNRMEDTARSPSPLPAPAATLESRDLVPAAGKEPLTGKAPQASNDAPIGAAEAANKPDAPSAGLSEVAAVQVRNISPREMGNIAMDLYISGVLSWDEYSMLAFQPELHPNYDATVGALTGERASPDQPRDFVGQWEDRLNFERRHNPGDRPLIRRTSRIVRVLRQIENPTDIII